jgi:predicted ATPase
LLLLLEDIHWLDEGSLNLTLSLSRALPNLPILLLLVHRPPLSTERAILPELDALPYHHPISLTELSDEGVAALIEQRWGGTLTPLTLALVQAQAQGNPYFVEELVNALQEAGHLYLNEADQRGGSRRRCLLRCARPTRWSRRRGSGCWPPLCRCR